MIFYLLRILVGSCCFHLSAISCCELAGVEPHFAFWLFCCCRSLQRLSLCFVASSLACAAFCRCVGCVGDVVMMALVSPSALFPVHSVPSAVALVAARFCGADALLLGGAPTGAARVGVGSANAGLCHGPACAQTKRRCCRPQ